MYCETTTNNPPPQEIIAGIQKSDCNIEFFGIHETMEVRFLQNGKTHLFKELKGRNLAAVINAYKSDPAARNLLRSLKTGSGQWVYPNFTRQLELYVYFCFGHLDGTPDIVNGVLSRPENYRHRRDCISLQFKNKTLHINGNELKPREITMIDGFADDLPDKAIADKLGIALPTFDQHKRTLYDKAGNVKTKTSFMLVAMKNKLISAIS
ncbi:helix-turn-helix transcriptional regulator [Flavobacteriaceae bacterium TK19130]|nr:helix-turn-helix transcriptional regulator [Thermobacterium salinum]